MENFATASEHREYFLLDIEGTISWRRKNAIQYPDDLRNTQCADALEKLESYVNQLDSHPLFDEMARVDIEQLQDYSEDQKYHLSRFGFDNNPEPPNEEELLQTLLSELKKL